ncbi:MAG: DEAD/DEAH box helicase [Acidobacteria bacterium]|nr:DEAD/DEAH box helicase [Acidobacteriota bacterium]
MPFTALGLGPKITKAIKEARYEEPTPIQAKAIPVVLEGRDVIGVAQTGTGKTAAFVLPMLEKMQHRGQTRNMRALVIAPTRELVVQIEENVQAYGRHLHLRYKTIYGGVGEQPQIDALRRGVDFVVATPGRLLDLMGRGIVNFSDIEFVVLDEADRMLDMGFLPSIKRIVAALPKTRQTLLFSATLSKEIEGIAKDFLKNPVTVQIGARSTPAELVTQHVIEVPKAAKTDLLIHLLKDQALEMVLVFSRTKHGADKIARKLAQAGIATATLHSNRTQGQRMQALKRFRSGEVRCLIATDIAARGIDVDGISHVVNFDFPPQPEDYVHRIGRTGRAQAIGDAISFVAPDEADSLRLLERFLRRGIPRRKVEGIDLRLTEAAAKQAADLAKQKYDDAIGKRAERGRAHSARRGGDSRPSASGDTRKPGRIQGRNGLTTAKRDGVPSPFARSSRDSSPARGRSGSSQVPQRDGRPVETQGRSDERRSSSQTSWKPRGPRPSTRPGGGSGRRGR